MRIRLGMQIALGVLAMLPLVGSQADKYRVVLCAGGSLLKILGALAGSNDVDWSKWHVFFGDERNVPHRYNVDSQDVRMAVPDLLLIEPFAVPLMATSGRRSSAA